MIIALSAKKRCGKDSVADMLVKRGFVKYALADPIRKYLVMAIGEQVVPDFIRNFTLADFEGNGYDREKALPINNLDAANLFCTAWHYYAAARGLKDQRQVYAYIDEICNANTEAWSIRRMLQTFGTDIGCHFNPMIWLEFAEEFIAINKDVVITDCRQPWEMDKMREMNISVVHIVRPGYSDVVTDTHSTEQGLPVDEDQDYVIYNIGTLEELDTYVEVILNHITNME